MRVREYKIVKLCHKVLDYQAYETLLDFQVVSQYKIVKPCQIVQGYKAMSDIRRLSTGVRQ